LLTLQLKNKMKYNLGTILQFVFLIDASTLGLSRNSHGHERALKEEEELGDYLWNLPICSCTKNQVHYSNTGKTMVFKKHK